MTNTELATKLIADLDRYSSRYWLALLVMDAQRQVGWVSACRCVNRVSHLQDLLDQGMIPMFFIGVTPGPRTKFDGIFWGSEVDEGLMKYFKTRVASLEKRVKDGSLKELADHVRVCSGLGTDAALPPWEVHDSDVERMHQIRLEKIAEIRSTLSPEAYHVIQDFETNFMFWVRAFSENTRPPRWWELENQYGKDVMSEAHDAWLSITMVVIKQYPKKS